MKKIILSWKTATTNSRLNSRYKVRCIHENWGKLDHIVGIQFESFIEIPLQQKEEHTWSENVYWIFPDLNSLTFSISLAIFIMDLKDEGVEWEKKT